MPHDQLLVDLSPEQSAFIEGGYTLHLHRIKAIRTGADPDNTDEAYLTGSLSFNGRKTLWKRNMRSGDVARINKSFSILTRDRKFLTLFDRDGLLDLDDPIDTVSISRLPCRRAKARLQGSGSTYVLTYSITA